MFEHASSRLVGTLVVLEPLAARHEDGLWRAAAHPGVWDWMAVRAGDSRAAFTAWFDDALGRGAARLEVPFATLDAATGVPLGSTRYLNLRPADRSLEIGATWLTPGAWGTGANVESKLLLLRRAFEELGCLRVELKTDARNERSRSALAALPAQFEGIHRKHMLVRGGERRDTAWYSVLDDEWPAVEANLLRRLGGEGD